jgi:hypothetical protein
MMAVGLTLFAGQASAAEAAFAQVTALKGPVAVNQAGHTAALTSGASLKAGDRIVAMENAQAQIKFADGCVIQVQSNAVATVGDKSPCAGAQLVGGSNPMQLDENTTVIFGGVAIVALLTLFFINAIDDDHEAISP